MNRADCRALRSAALELVGWSKALKSNAEADGRFQEGTPAWRVHEKHLALVRRLRRIANEVQAKLPRGTGRSRRERSGP